jgi:adenylate kinase
VNLILFGPPGAGKGTQAQFLVKKYNFIQLSTGDLLRNEIKKKSVLGKDIENIISKGNLVSDHIVNDLLKIAISNLNMESKVIFDGYPRNIEQANNLQKILKQNQKYINFIIYLNVKREIANNDMVYFQLQKLSSSTKKILGSIST